MIDKRRHFLTTTATASAGVVLGACGGGSGSANATASSPDNFFTMPKLVLPNGTRTLVTSADGFKISVREYGNPSGKAILFLNGGLQSQVTWFRQFTDATLLSKYRLITYDCRGHGESEKTIPAGGKYTPSMQADDIQAILTTLGVSKAVFAGWSMGVLYTADYVRKYGTSKLDGHVGIGGAWRFATGIAADDLVGTGLTDNAGQAFSSDLHIRSAGTQGFIQAFRATPMPEDEFALIMGGCMFMPAENRIAHVSRPADYLDRDFLPTFTVRGLIVQGALDSVSLKAQADLAAVAWKTARYSVYANAGHAPFLDEPARFNQELASFVG